MLSEIKKYVKIHILDIILVILMLLTAIVVIWQSNRQKDAYSESYGRAILTKQASESAPIVSPTPTPVITPIPTPSPTPTPIPIPTYDIALPVDLQEYTYNICNQYAVDYELALSMMYVESKYNPDTIGSSGELGLMQIHPINFDWLQEELGQLDFTNPKDNILAGVYMLSDLQAEFDSLEKAVSAYNVGETKMRKLANRGVARTQYADKVQVAKEELEERK